MPPPIPKSNSIQQQVLKVSLSQPVGAKGHRVLLYGPGGIGKTSLACQCPGPVAFCDLDESLDKLHGQLKRGGIKMPSVFPGTDWALVRASLKSQGWDGIKTIVIDSVTKLEELAIAYTLQTVKGPGDCKVDKIEDYGFGKGYQYAFDVFLSILADFDKHCRAGRNIVLIAHDCTHTVPNPAGQDFLRYEPRLQDPASGKGSIRLRVREWADHMLFLNYDIAFSSKPEDKKKAKGSGTRTLYTAELPFCMAKCRTTQDQIPIDGSDVWAKILQ
jgi:hypothetical protein